MSQPNTDIEELNAWMRAHHLHGFWVQGGGGTGVQVKPHLWKWAASQTELTGLVGTPSIGREGTAPRMLRFRNPEQRGVPGTISLSLQVLMPAERASAQRSLHNQTWLVVEAPNGANVLLDDTFFSLRTGDLAVAPGGTDMVIHNDGSQPAILLHTTDADLVGFIGANVTDLSELPLLRPPAIYAWIDTVNGMATFKADGGGNPHDGIHLRYTSPIDGEPTLPTYSCEMQLLPPGLETRPHRHNSTATYFVFRGVGHTRLAGEQLEWAQGDVFCVPPWALHSHGNTGDEDAVLYSVDDWPTMTKMGFYRVEGDEA
jgi:gentisate 1,2-dioxygenase